MLRLISASLVATVSLTAAAAAAPPLTEGLRLVPAEPSAYDRAKLSGGVPKDGIPSIDDPQFWSAERGDEYLDDGDVVFGIVRDGEARAYPQRILVWHEIVNDEIAGDGIAVTYCPLTGTAQAFERGDTELGVSGRLVNSNLIMYDRDSDTWFPQILGTGISGPGTGKQLRETALVWTTWGAWKARYPDTDVLSTETGVARNYSRDPYGSYNPRSGYYAGDSQVMFEVMNSDDRFQTKDVVLGARTTETAVAFHLDALRDEGVMTVGGGESGFTAVYDEDLDTGYVFRGTTSAEPRIGADGFGPDSVTWEGGEALTPVTSFEAMWFAWAAFYPDTVVGA